MWQTRPVCLWETATWKEVLTSLNISFVTFSLCPQSKCQGLRFSTCPKGFETHASRISSCENCKLKCLVGASKQPQLPQSILQRILSGDYTWQKSQCVQQEEPRGLLPSPNMSVWWVPSRRDPNSYMQPVENQKFQQTPVPSARQSWSFPCLSLSLE